MDETEPKEGHFKVRDRRRFSSEPTEAPPSIETPAEPERQEQAETPTEKAPASIETPAEPEKQEQAETPTEKAPETGEAPLEITFSSFVISLSTQAMISLDGIKGTQDSQAQSDLPAARQIIDILGVLKEKTSGNLDPNESRLLESLLYDLRMMYVQLTQGK